MSHDDDLAREALAESFADVTTMVGYLSRMSWPLPEDLTVDAHARTPLGARRP